MKTYTRKCPDCNKEIYHKNKYSCFNNHRSCASCAAKKRIKKYGNNEQFKKLSTKGYLSGINNPFYGKKHTNETKKKISENTNRQFMQTPEYKQKISNQTKGRNNPMYNKTYYQIWVQKYGKEKADELQKIKNKKTSEQCKGKNNPMYGKPSPQGSGNGWKGWYNNWFFRSLKELSYVVNVLEPNNTSWESAEKSNIVIPYTWQGRQKTYRPDFLVNKTLLVEIKPTKLKSSISVRLKQSAAEEFALTRGWKYEIIDPPTITNEQLLYLHDNHLLQFTEKYEIKFQELHLE